MAYVRVSNVIVPILIRFLRTTATAPAPRGICLHLSTTLMTSDPPTHTHMAMAVPLDLSYIMCCALIVTSAELVVDIARARQR